MDWHRLKTPKTRNKKAGMLFLYRAIYDFNDDMIYDDNQKLEVDLTRERKMILQCVFFVHNNF